MPPVSKKQARLFRAVASGDVELPSMSPAKAEEMVSGYKTKGLPETAASTPRKTKRPLWRVGRP